MLGCPVSICTAGYLRRIQTSIEAAKQQANPFVPGNYHGALIMAAPGSYRGFDGSPDLVRKALGLLTARFGDQVSVAKGIREQHANITTWHPAEFPDAVVFPDRAKTPIDGSVGAQRR